MNKRKVLVTGATGYIAGLLLPELRRRYDLTLLDIKTTDRDGNEVKDVQIADLSESDRDSCRRHFQGVDSVVHCGYTGWKSDNTSEDRFRSEIKNIEMAYNVYQTSLEEGVRRVVVSSSNHAADYYEHLILDGKRDTVQPNERALSNNYYGWAKESYEHLGFIFASGNMGPKPLENVQIRIGAPRENDLQRYEEGDLRLMRRALGAYISQRDLSQLYVKSIEAEDIRDEEGVPFQIFYGISGNFHAFWSIANARRIIGYEPQDKSEIRFRQTVSDNILTSQKAEEASS